MPATDIHLKQTIRGNRKQIRKAFLYPQGVLKVTLSVDTFSLSPKTITTQNFQVPSRTFENFQVPSRTFDKSKKSIQKKNKRSTVLMKRLKGGGGEVR